tara:strand:- start:9456 stop:10607 length:1152 start_codon:yes stop_codon:yes gene_type:complete
MKRIIVIHNKYRILGGEDIAVENEIIFLKEHFEVKEVYFENTISNYFHQAISFLTNNNRRSKIKISDIIKEFNPDLAYVHNTWFKASPGIFKVLEKHNINTVLKLHNFRYDCTRFFLSRNHVREGEVCFRCGYGKESSGVFNKYFKDSFLRSFFVIWYGKAYFQILNKSKIKILVLTKFHHDYLESLGLDPSKVNIFRNSLNVTNNSKEKSQVQDYIVYAGRISNEKGVKELLDSFLDSDLKDTNIKIIGDGPELSTLKKQYKNSKIEFLGLISNEHVKKIIQKAKAVITGTKLYEGQPMLLCEASSFGVPSIFPRFGGIEEFYPSDSKLSFEQFNYEDLKEKINLLSNLELLEIEGKNNKDFILDILDRDNLIEDFKKIINE